MPIPPGLVMLIVVAAKSSAVSLPLRARRMMSSYVPQNAAKSIASAPLTDATTSERESFLPTRSMAMPRLTCSGVITAGLPSMSPKALFICGCTASALTIA